MTAEPCALRPLVDRHFSGQLPPPDERRMREHLPGCLACRDHYERHLLLARLTPGALDARTRLGRGLGVDLRETRPPWRPALLALATVGVALLGVHLSLPARETPASGFTARGGGPVEEGPRLIVYAVGARGESTPVGATMGARQELAFAYFNPGARSHLLVFGVDEAGRVYWYHPAWTDPGADPQALPIRAGQVPYELPEAISQPLVAGRLTLYGVFLDEPLTVRALEARLARAGGVAEALPAGADVRSVEVRVAP